MFPTTEVRWFHPGAIPPGVNAWFEHIARSPGQFPPRADHYLRMGQEDDTLGIKLREGRIEIKQLRLRHGPTQFGHGVQGNVEHWQKWAWPLDAQRMAPLGYLLGDGSWISVQKNRSLRYFAQAQGLVRAITDTESLGEKGCHLELTSVQVERERWWTVGIETVGRAHYDDLVCVANYVFDDQPPVPLDLASSCSYPAWLRRLRGAG